MHGSLMLFFGIAAAVLNCIGTVPYVRDILRGKTKPERGMWWVYSALFVVLFIAQAESGAGWLLLVTGAYIAAALLIAGLSLRYGYGGFHWRDTVSLVVAGIGLAAWWMLDQPLITALLIIGVDFAGSWLTLVKAWHAPHTETLVSWQLSLVAAVCSLFAIDTVNASTLAYPVYAVVGGAFVVWLIMYRRTKVKEDPRIFRIQRSSA
jgi:hypothetical protein